MRIIVLRKSDSNTEISLLYTYIFLSYIHMVFIYVCLYRRDMKHKGEYLEGGHKMVFER